MEKNNQEGISAPMPQYLCHKTVYALKIKAIEINEDKSATIAPQDDRFAVFTTEPGWAERWRGSEEDPGYYMVYQDGYKSWSPTKVFEDGYMRVNS